VESPASLLGFVYASKILQNWARQKHEDGEWDEQNGTGLRQSRRTKVYDREKNVVGDDAGNNLMMKMGPFQANWGIEIDKTT